MNKMNDEERMVLERVCRVGVMAGKQGEKLKLAVGTK